jgi:hypothetical protein
MFERMTDDRWRSREAWESLEGWVRVTASTGALIRCVPIHCVLNS